MSRDRAIKILVFLLTAWSPLAGHAQPLYLDLTEQSPRSLGAAGSYITFADDQSAFTANPAGISRHSEYRKIFLGQHFVDGWKDWALQAAVIDGKTEDPLHWGFSFNTVHTNLERKDRYSLGLSFNWRNLFLIGFTNDLFNFGNKTLTNDEWSYGMNFGTLIFLGDYVSIGAAIIHGVKMRDDANPLPRSYNAGLSLNLLKLRMGAEVDRDQDRKKFIYRGSFEYQPMESTTLRAGYHQDQSGHEKIYSFGISLQPVGDRFGLDLGYLDQLESNFETFSVGMSLRL
ncbi:MAG: hypothetical protein COV44_01860 [Deltaproteobacteria bacterium CG11_big_fil_rev_8_21_14_0_20_45_16]|nr:MAG: hypothetical protein COV44_01860 [Deltaproteobacteria bacterium CG11_big_fil_rev_8_21_14_0_20_45_16]